MALAFACGPYHSEPTPQGEDVTEVSGTVEFISLESGFYAIRAADGKTYDPINLPKEYQRHGMRVRVKARMRNDVASAHMAGPSIEILSIDKM
jgi:hypothetical protein